MATNEKKKENVSVNTFVKNIYSEVAIKANFPILS